MDTFLKEIIVDIHHKNYSISEIIFIVPSKRAGLFLKKELISYYNEDTFFAPTILSIEEFIAQLSGLQEIDAIETLFEFYTTYLNIHTHLEKEDFETFSSWAQILVQDFNEIDRYCVDYQSFFSYLSGIQDLNHWYLQKEKTTLIQNYISFWNHLSEYYQNFKENLLKKKIGYQGLLYRVASENIHAYSKKNNQKHIFVGFNALNNAEQSIFQTLLEANIADTYWDADRFFIENKYHEASLFLRNFKNNWKYYQQQPFQWIQDNFSKEKDIKLIGVSKKVGQAKLAGKILKSIPSTDMHKTALVLSDESLLLPMLNALPSTLDAVNITMGLPLKEVPLASFFEQLYKLHKKPNPRGLYYVDVLQILNSQAAYWLLGANTTKIVNTISNENIVYVSIKKLQSLVDTAFTKEIILLLFDTWKNSSHAITSSKKIIAYLKNNLDKEKNALELEYMYRFHVVFNRVITLHNKYDYLTSINTLYRLYKDVMLSETLDFIGEPYSGLQLMGMLESRCLDFDTVLITSVNEGILPAGKSPNSFIPYDLKRAYNLPTYREKDAIYTYHFYRLIQRAKNVYIIYNTENEGVGGGEKSRFLHQLEIDKMPAHRLSRYIASSDVPQLIKQVREIPKNNQVIERIKELTLHGLSPSALTTYIRNPLDFYYQYILGVQESEQVEETIAANTLGTVIHNTLETFYKPFENKFLDIDDIHKMKKQIDTEISYQFKKEYTSLDITQGKNLLIFEVAKKYIANFLLAEESIVQSGSKIRILGIEQNLKAKIEIQELDFPVYIKGKVDRIDELDGQLRIIDYKTGRVDKNDIILRDWNVVTDDYKYNKVIQVLAYAYMYHAQNLTSGSFEAGIISFKNLKERFMRFGIREDKKVNYEVTSQVFDNYLAELKKIIVQIATLKSPFTEKEII